MKKFLLYLLIFVMPVVSCTREKFVTVEHSMKVEFGADASDSQTEISVLYHDFRGVQITQEEIKSTLEGADADLVFVSCDWNFNVSTASGSVPSGYDSYDYVDGHMACTSLSSVSFRAVGLDSGNCLSAKVGDCMFMIGATTLDDGNDIVEKTIFGVDGQSWIILLPEQCNVLTDYTFTDCLAAQSGLPGDDIVRDCYVYASQGVWNRMSFIEENPVRFSVNIEQE